MTSIEDIENRIIRAEEEIRVLSQDNDILNFYLKENEAFLKQINWYLKIIILCSAFLVATNIGGLF